MEGFIILSTNINAVLYDVAHFYTKIYILFFCIIIIFLINPRAINASDIPNPNNISAIAIYSAMTYSPDIPDDEVNYNITDPAVIESVFQGIENKPRDCSNLEAGYLTYLYVKYDTGNSEVFAVSGYYVYFQKLYSDVCYWIFPDARSIIKNNIQN